jgi:WD40-like Beta Propeller Repeat
LSAHRLNWALWEGCALALHGCKIVAVQRWGLTAITGVVLTAVVAVAASAGGSLRPNGQIAFDRADPASTSGDTFLVTANPDGRHARRLFRGHTCCPGWSHDGSRLSLAAVLPGDRIGAATIRADGTGYKVLRLNDRTLNVGCPVWSQNDRILVCEGWDEKRAGRQGLYTLPSAIGGTPERLTRNPIGGSDLPGSYSPDGKRLVFSRFDKHGNGTGLFIVNANGTGVRRITPPGTVLQGGNTGDWSPVGNRIIFSRRVSDAPGSIWIINADGSGLREIQVSGRDCGGAAGCHQPRWSPDGRSFVFASNSGERSDIYTVKANGSGLKRITSGGRDDNPAWGSHPAR